MYIYSYLFCLYYCKDCCHRVTTQLQLVIIIIIIIIIIITYLALPTYFGRCSVEGTERLSGEAALNVPSIVSTE